LEAFAKKQLSNRHGGRAHLLNRRNLSNPEQNAELFNMQDLLVEHDENIALWRYHHVLMVER
jgi:tryptophan 2,3-dioxygenase